MGILDRSDRGGTIQSPLGGSSGGGGGGAPSIGAAGAIQLSDGAGAFAADSDFSFASGILNVGQIQGHVANTHSWWGGLAPAVLIDPDTITSDHVLFGSKDSSSGNNLYHAILFRTGQVTGASASVGSGEVYIGSGDVQNSNQASGYVEIRSGNTTGSGASGIIAILAGTSGSGTRGYISIDGQYITCNSKQIRGVATPTASDHVATKGYVDGVAGGANTTLSNLTSPTAINQDLLPSGDGLRAIGSTSVKWGAIRGNNISAFTSYALFDSGGTGHLSLDRGVTLPSGQTGAAGLVSQGGTTVLAVWTPNTTASKSILVETGNASSGTSGLIRLQTGTGTSSTGDISILSGNSTGANSGVVSITTGSTVGGTTGGISIVTGINGNNTGALTLSTGAPSGGSGASGGISITTGVKGSSAGNTGAWSGGSGAITSGSSSSNTGGVSLGSGNTSGSGATGSLLLSTGNSTFGNSGTLTIQTGTAGGTRGNIVLNTRALDVTNAPIVGTLRPLSTLTDVDLGSGTNAFQAVYAAQIKPNTGNILAIYGDAGIDFYSGGDMTYDTQLFGSHIFSGGPLRLPTFVSAPTPTAPGDMYYDTTTNKSYTWDGTTWQAHW